MATLSNVAVASVDVEWLETARPMYTVDGMAIASVPTSDQELPSADWYAEMLVPDRVSLTQ